MKGEPCRAGARIADAEIGGTSCLDGRLVKNGKTLLSGVDPIRRAWRTADSVSLTGRTLYFCPSPLYGYGLDRLLSRLEEQAPDSAVLCAEADPELYALSVDNIPPSIAQNKKFHLTNITNEAALASFVRETWGTAFRRIETIRLTGGYQLFPELYDSLYKTLNAEIAVNWSNALTLTKLGRLYIRNFFRNIPLTERYLSISNLSFGEAPVLVLGAGPSIDQLIVNREQSAKDNEIETEKLNYPEKRSFKIICVDTCLGALKDRGIVPDLVVILESQHWNLRDFSGCKGWKVPAVIDLSALPASVRALDGGGYFFFTPWTQLRVFERLKDTGLLPASIPPLGSVGLTAVEIARRLTKGKIILCGLDFSFTQDKYHARGTPGHRGSLKSQTRFKRIGNIAAFAAGVSSALSKSGVSVYSSPVMRNYRDLFEREFGGDSRLFDIEGTGLPLGVKTLSMEEALKELGINKLYHEPSGTSADQYIKHRLLEARCKYRNIEQQTLEARGKNQGLISFLENEKKRLEELRSILSGETAYDQQRLEILIEELDYLWAHFPDCATGRRPDLSEVSFLKRVRVEIEPMLALIEAGFDK